MNYSGHSRTNYFRVIDPVAFKAWVARLALTLLEGGDGTFALAPSDWSESGAFPSRYPSVDGDMSDLDDDGSDDDLDGDALDGDDDFFINELRTHLTDDTVVVIMHAGHEGLRDICGRSWAFQKKGEVVYLDLSEIYSRAKAAFGVEPGEAEY